MGQKNVILVTPYPEFGDLVSHSIHKNLGWNVKALYNSNPLIDMICEYHSLDYALLDLELGFGQVRESVLIIRDKFPDVEITLISKKKPPIEAEDLRPWKLLTKPFVENDLLELFRYSDVTKSNIVIEGNCRDDYDENLPSWAQNTDNLRKILVNSFVFLDAQEAMLFTDEKILVQAGSGQGIDIDGCSKIVREYLNPTGTGEIIKQVNLNSKNYLLHATILAVGIILAILYRSDIPYNDVRYQTRYLEKCLENPKLSTIVMNAIPERIKVHIKNNNHMRKALLENINSFDTSAHPSSPGKHVIDPPYDKDRLSNTGNDSTEFQSKEVNPPEESGDSYETLFAKVKSNNRDTGSLITHTSSRLYYSCLLIPRIRTHHITNDLANYLQKEIPAIFEANGWRLEELYIDEHYMMWIALIPPTVAPTAHIKTIRRESSKLILQNFVKLSMDGMISDFWAPGFHLEPGNHKIADGAIAEFIHVNRQQYYPDESGN